MKIGKRTIIIVVLVIAILITSSGVSLYVYLKHHYRTRQEIEDYLSANCSRNPSIAYSDGWSICFSDRKVDLKDIPEIAELDIEVCGMTKDYVYFLEKVSSKTKEKNIYRADHSFSSIELVLSYISNGMTYLCKKGIRYGVEDGTRFFYSYQENKSSIDENYEYFLETRNKGNEYYSSESKPDGFNIFSNDKIYIITDKKSGVERRISQKYIDNIEKDEFMTCLADMGALNFSSIRLNDEDVYIVCSYGTIGILFEYDFENEKMYFVDWVEADLDYDFRSYFIDDIKLDEESKVDN